MDIFRNKEKSTKCMNNELKCIKIAIMQVLSFEFIGHKSLKPMYESSKKFILNTRIPARRSNKTSGQIINPCIDFRSMAVLSRLVAARSVLKTTVRFGGDVSVVANRPSRSVISYIIKKS